MLFVKIIFVKVAITFAAHMGCRLAAQMNKKTREVCIKFAYVNVLCIQMLYTATAIFFLAKRSCRSSCIELLLLSV